MLPRLFLLLLISALFPCGAVYSQAHPQEGSRESLTIEMLNQKAVAWFVDRPGAGISRMAPVNEIYLGDSAGRTADTDKNPSAHPGGETPGLGFSDIGAASGKARPGNFPGRMFRDPQNTLPMPDAKVDLLGAAFGVTDIQLIGIAMHDPPVAYIIENISDPSPHRAPKKDAEVPPMENLRNYKTRPLNRNEEQAIETLKSEPSTNVLVAGSTLTSAEVVGAIRATTSCLECHSGAKEGELLGAFSYTLKALPVPQAPPEVVPRTKL